MTEAIKPPPHATHCQTCGQKYVHFEHPLKPGVIMMSSCGCKPTLTQTPAEPEEHEDICEDCAAADPEIMAWLDKVREHVETETHLHYWINTEAGISKDPDAPQVVLMWPCPVDDPEDEDGIGMAFLNVDFLEVCKTFDAVSTSWIPGMLAFVGAVGERYVALSILEGPPQPDDEDEDDEADPN